MRWSGIHRNSTVVPVPVAAPTQQQVAAKYDADGTRFKVHDRVVKTTCGHRFRGVVIGVVQKRSGAWRYVVENDDGITHIFKAANIKLEANL
jgi:hypothetical protein